MPRGVRREAFRVGGISLDAIPPPEIARDARNFGLPTRGRQLSCGCVPAAEWPVMMSAQEKPLTIMLVVGEPSGDQLGAQLMAGLKQLAGDTLRIVGVGGPAMTAQGLDLTTHGEAGYKLAFGGSAQ